MIRVFALVLVAAALGAAAAWYLRAETGYVLVSYRHWILETSLLGFLATVVAGLLALYYGARGVVALLKLPVRIQEELTRRRQQRAQQSFESGLMKLLEGNFAAAEIELVRRAADHPAPALNYMLAARAAHLGGIAARRDQYLELASRHGDNTLFASRLLRAELQLEQDAASAQPVLEEIRRGDPAHPYVIELLARAYARSGAWDALRRLLSGTDATRALAPAHYKRLYARALAEGLTQAAQGARRDTLKSLWDAAPPPVRGEREVVRAYVRGLARLGDDAAAAAQIVQSLKQDWDPALVEAYGALGGLDPVTQLAAVEGWLTQQGEKPELLLAAGLACTRNQLWGKARSYLDAALRAQPTPAVFLALAKLCELTQQTEDAAMFHRRGLELATTDQPSFGQVSKA